MLKVIEIAFSCYPITDAAMAEAPRKVVSGMES